MKQKLNRFMAGFMAMLTLVGTLFTNGTTAFAASPQANIASVSYTHLDVYKRQRNGRYRKDYPKKI